MPRRISLLLALAGLAGAAPAHAARPAFGPALPPLGIEPGAVAIVDLNRDGRQDLVAARVSGVTVHLAQADGTYDSAGPYVTGGTSAPNTVRVAELTGDGRPDLVVWAHHELHALHAQPGGGFVSALVAAPPDEPVVADTDGDGRAELLYAQDTVRVGEAQPDGSYAWEQLLTAADAEKLAAGDIDGDGHTDLIAFHAQGSASLLPGTPSGLGPPRTWAYPVAPGDETMLRDIDADGRGDLVLRRGRLLLVRHGRPGPDFGPEVSHDLGGTGGRLLIADLNGDGRLDVGTKTADAVTVLPGVLGGELGAPVNHPLLDGVVQGFGDLDGDVRPDALISRADGLHVLPNRTQLVTLAPPVVRDDQVTVTHALAGFPAAVHSLELHVKGPQDADFVRRSTVFPPRSGTTTFTVAGDGDVRIKAVAVGWDGEPLVTSEPQEVTTRVDPATTFAVQAFSFGEHVLGSEAQRPLTITNTGVFALRGLSVQLQPAGDFTLVGGPCPARIAPGAACTLSVRYRATTVARSEATVHVTGNGPPQQATISATGLHPPPTATPNPTVEPQPTVDPTPAVTPAATAGPQPTPTPTPRPSSRRTADPKPGQARLAYDMQTPTRTSTRLLRLRLERVQAGSTISVRCARGCPARSFTKRNARGTVSLGRFATRALKVGTTIKITITEPGAAQPVLVTIVIRSQREPKVTMKLVEF
ncbi:VCBS repeat-containing protein [Solirubrobacter sp. CPCC 204708]|uniref:FG-GAP-like repeat-containing protein n=1 Tax=Solirubrobacter deserti TaxID=2282478 RepID=A0ABT4RRQ6_9ACTN|nr:FG-GAP-like repeat-containing protein [Solirubrobacter deserti]MBE2317588.1 VCBS repeat-containing protein [Solirubrobacter deserti]MDA0141282.1 FG-GAP-like repeat-containing protein [Solirubrobacter deserti]